ncbi:TPA: Na+/H+ antiporter NhaC [Mannheimia haemolytica]|uniref:Sodium/proton antiporter n=1 Tax=Mannheimia haemolytica TaxID=75985 RepID=A0A378NCT1_MANHA|nr:Na+/H+ antiporter NhaC [Mannheimia haemolytica]AGQ39669.1 sodium:proton antiporter [Mannheimia haemolytica D171]EEY10515.1 Na+/H+ antiporter NhaC [Mannheimia haemolytica serotype A2 str. OVINE]EEY11704.1 Na+/H+ antiporter NhaC [Mannheimia haemolytica serotype A2 str. BOVINE]KYL17833.1 sodium:proton antiporter [Mannheimia haemolytica]KYL23414.1 sodium:proton antiporter [Mannheimia haemolytica]
MNNYLLKLKPMTAVILSLLTVFILGFTMIGLGWVPQISILAVIVMLLLFGLINKIPFKNMQEGMASGLMSGIGAVYLFFFIGLLVSALMMSGAIPTLMYYGLSVISPELFYISAFALSSVVGIALGSSLTTTATIGVAFIGMASAFGANPAIVAGAVVSGAFFGDKTSPLSDTTTIAASVVGIDMFAHIRNMLYTTIPAWILTALFLWFLTEPTDAQNLANIENLKTNLQETGLIHGYSLLPFVTLILMAIKRVNSIYIIVTTVTLSLIITYIHSSPTLEQLGNYFFTSYKPVEGVDLGEVASLVSRGGINSMFFTITIVLLALSLGGLLQILGILPALLNGISGFLTSTGRVTLVVASTAVGINVLIGEQYLSLLLSGNTFRSTYERLGLEVKNLSRTIEDAGTVINPLVPWGVCGVFISSVLNVPVLDYLPYAFFCYICLILTLIFGFTGVTISKKAN